MAYSKTWGTTPGLGNALTAASLNKAEREAAKMWVSDLSQSWARASPFLSNPTGARAFNTFYENDEDYPMLVIASIRVTADLPAVGASGVGEAVLELTDANQLNPYEPAGVRQSPPSIAGSPQHTGQVFGVVNPGEHYRLRNISTNGASAAIRQVQELVLDKTYVPQTWLHGDGPTPLGNGVNVVNKLNTYVRGVNAIVSKNLDFRRTNIDAHNSNVVGQEDNGARLALLMASMSYPQPGLITDPVGICEVRVEDTGNPGVAAASESQGIETDVNALGAALTVPSYGFVNQNGDWDIVEVAGAQNTDIVTDRGHRIDFQEAPADEFAQFGGTETSVLQQLLDMDQRASEGLEVQNSAFTRKQNQALPYTAPSAKWALVAIRARITPPPAVGNTTYRADATIGATTYSQNFAVTANADLGSFDTTILCIVSAGAQLTANVPAAASTEQVTAWEIP